MFVIVLTALIILHTNDIILGCGYSSQNESLEWYIQPYLMLPLTQLIMSQTHAFEDYSEI